MKKLLIASLLLLLQPQVWAATYTVKTSAGDYSAPGTCANAVSAGDICEVYNGTYSGWTQTASGSAGSGYITVKNATGQTPAISSSVIFGTGGGSYVRIEGLSVSGSVTCQSTTSGTPWNNLQIVSNEITGASNPTNTAVAMALNGNDGLIESNVFTGWRNDIMRVHGARWAIRKNRVYDMDLSLVDPGAAHFDFFQSYCSPNTADGVSAQYILFEENTLTNVTGTTNEHLLLINDTDACPAYPPINIIVRYNKVDYLGSNAVYIDNNAQSEGATDNVIYNNTFSRLTLGTPATWQDGSCTLNGGTNGRFFNNINVNAMDSTNAIGIFNGTGGTQSYNLYYNSSGTMTFSGAASAETSAVKNQNPLLTNPAGNNFSIPENSPAKDAGGHLTTVHADDTGSGVSLIVADAAFFQPGWGGSNADWICVGATLAAAECMQLSAINYSTNTITVADFTREDGDSVWLYKKSDGVIVLYGTAPDIGAYEYQEGVSNARKHQLPTGHLQGPAGAWMMNMN